MPLSARSSGAFVRSDLTQDRGAGGWQLALAFATGSPRGQQTPGTPGPSRARERHRPLPKGTEDARGRPGPATHATPGWGSERSPTRMPATPWGLWAAVPSGRERKRRREGMVKMARCCHRLPGPRCFPMEVERDCRYCGALSPQPQRSLSITVH